MSSNYEDRDLGFEQYDRTMPRGPRRLQRRKICRFCIEKVDLIDFKDVKLLQGYVDRDLGFEQYDRTMPRGPRRLQRRKICRFCIEKVDLIDFKDVKLLQGY